MRSLFFALLTLAMVNCLGCSANAAPDKPSASPVKPAALQCPADAHSVVESQKAWAAYLNLPGIEITNSIGMKFRVIPPGKFKMGASPKEVAKSAPENESPQHTVELTHPFLIGATEVTQGEWKEVMTTEPWAEGIHTKVDPRAAASFITYFDALMFIERINKREKTKRYRLPTEAEWEYACRAGTETAWYFGDDKSLAVEHGWFGNFILANAEEVQEEYAHVAARKLANSFGLFDVCGNVSEWCQDEFQLYTESTLVNPMVKSTKADKEYVTRGGCYWFPAVTARSASRGKGGPEIRVPMTGFRVVCDIEEPK